MIQLDARKNFSGGSIPKTKGLSVFVGGNGSGKSSLLEAIFLRDITTPRDGLTVAFTSGPNENFSELYVSLQRQKKRELNLLKTLDLKVFLFDLTWAPLLVALAAFINRDDETPSLTTKFLRDRKYRLDDLKLKVRLPRNFLTKIQVDEELLTSAFVLVIEKITGSELLEIEQGKTIEVALSESVTGTVLRNEERPLSGELFSAFLELVEAITPLMRRNPGAGTASPRVKAVRRLIAAFEIGSLNNSIFNLSKVDLRLRNENGREFSLRHLSDGEYQLLMTLAILDIFDETDSILIMDEMDSHVHQRLVPELWQTFASSESAVFTTTHNPTSLKYCDLSRVKALRSGQLTSGAEMTEELSAIFDCDETANRVLALGFRNRPNLVVLDGYKDWIIFITLMKRKLGADFDPRFESEVTVYKVSSSQNGRYSGDNAKALFATELMRHFKKELTNTQQRQKALKKIILVNDRDTSDFSDRYGARADFRVIRENPDLRIEQNGPHAVSTTHVFWHRREIENYLLVPEILEGLSDATPVGQIGTTATVANVGGIKAALANGDEETLATVDCKSFVTPLISNMDHSLGADLGFSQAKLNELVETIRPENISNYLVKMYDLLSQELFRR